MSYVICDYSVCIVQAFKYNLKSHICILQAYGNSIYFVPIDKNESNMQAYEYKMCHLYIVQAIGYNMSHMYMHI